MKRIESGQVVLLNPRIGQGKTTFERAIVKELADTPVRVITPADLSPTAQLVWRKMNGLYLDPSVQEKMGRKRAEGELPLTHRAALQVANWDLVRELDASSDPVLAMHGMIAKDLRRNPRLRRSFAEGDMWPESTAIDNQTLLFVPNDDVKLHVERMARTNHVKPEIEVAGFIVPRQLLGEDRISQLKDFYASGEPTREKPLRIAYLMTGQIAHMEELESVFKSNVGQMLTEQRVKLDVYMYNDRNKAKEVQSWANKLEVESIITDVYDPNFTGMQILCSKDAVKAVEGKFAMAEKAHLFITPGAENMAWAGTTPIIPLPSIAGNEKIHKNTRYLVNKGLSGPEPGIHDLGASIDMLFANNGAFVERHFGKATEVFDGNLNGAANIAARMREELQRAA